MKTLKITTAEIAHICGVSQGTVDRALNDRPDIKAETKEKILAVARQYGWRQKLSAAPEKIIGQIGIVVFNLENEYFTELISELESALWAKGLGATIMLSHYDKEREIECIRNLYNMGVLGIVLCAVQTDAAFSKYLELLDIPIVAVGNPISGRPYVGIDDFAAMRDMTEHVLSKNPKKLLYFSPALLYSDAAAQKKRYEGFLAAADGMPYEVITSADALSAEYPEGTHIICSTDYYALRVYFKTRGAHITGFDNIRALANYKISVDSVGYETAEIARGALRVLTEGEKKDIWVAHRIVPHAKNGE